MRGTSERFVLANPLTHCCGCSEHAIESFVESARHQTVSAALPSFNDNDHLRCSIKQKNDVVYKTDGNREPQRLRTTVGLLLHEMYFIQSIMPL